MTKIKSPYRAGCKTPTHGKNALLSHFATPSPSPTPLEYVLGDGALVAIATVKLTQNHHFFHGLEFFNRLYNLSSASL
jgi:hypothetical protein